MSHKIQLKFDDKQEHQLLAIQSTVDLFKGMARQEAAFHMGDEIIPNLPQFASLDENWLFGSLREVQEANHIGSEPSLATEEGFELEGISVNSWRYPNFTLEMETGTGKTYVYLRAILELRKHYGFSKFVVVVPSIAIYEGVIKNFEITRAHFRALYDNETIHLTPYDGQQLSKLRNFASSSFTEILLITLDSFNKKSNVIFKPSEKLPGERKPFQFIQDTRPILILDEPQNMESELAKAALRSLHPLFALRYSATHRSSPNLFYRLTPVEAFRRNLVKKIQVYGIKEEENWNQYQLALDRFSPYGLKARIRTLISVKGETKDAELEVQKGDDLYEKTKLEAYRGKGFVVDLVDKALGIVVFQNQQQISLKDKGPQTKQDVFRVQIEETIERHMQAQTQLKKKSIKVLSLFFIDRVANYTDKENPIIKTLFDEAFNKIKRRYDYFKAMKPEEVRSAYFAVKKTKSGEEVAFDTEGKNEEERRAEKDAFKLIMKDKERLLSFDEKVAFIFAHSALKEGWDNPNVFQICTLNQTRSEMRKRQEIGRGLRICVDQQGERVQDDGVNILTVVANDSYESYVRNLQLEYTEDGDVAPQGPSNARRKSARRNDKVFRSKDFRSFWEKLASQTQYTINVATEALIEKCIATLKAATFPEPQIVVTKGKFVITNYLIELESAKGNRAKLKVSITDTAGNTAVNTYSFEEGGDLQKTFHDDRLKNFRIGTIVDDGADSKVEFVNGQELTKYAPIRFDSEIGQKVDSRATKEAEAKYPVPNFIDRVARETGLTRPTIIRIFKGLPQGRKELVFKNPEGFANTFLGRIREVLADHIAERIEYEAGKAGSKYELEDLFPETKSFPQKEMIEAQERSIYDQIQIDSEVEGRFVRNRLQKEDEVILYFKFPAGFKINVPKIIGNYNPDWGIIRFNEDKSIKLQLVRETKGSADPNLLQFTNEKRKIACAEKHFDALGMDYRQITGEEIFWWKKPERAK